MITKICGIKKSETLYCCEKNNVNFFGMIFYERSPRNISIDQAKHLQEISKNLNINGVGVFVDYNLNELKNIVLNLNLKYVQLHGEENNDYINSLKENNIKIIKKISINEEEDLNKIKKFHSADIILFDYKPLNNELPGGNAKKFDWSIVKNLKLNRPWFLSGGINLHNISVLVREIKPFGIDLSSGVEKELGIKDNVMINKLMGNIINA